MKNSKKRDQILKLFEKGELLTANEVCDKLNTIDRATIYRNINLFVELGILREVNVKKGISSYELNTDHHQHFICTDCEKIIPVEVDDRVIKEFLPVGVEVSDFELNLKGKCTDCK